MVSIPTNSENGAVPTRALQYVLPAHVLEGFAFTGVAFTPANAEEAQLMQAGANAARDRSKLETADAIFAEYQGLTERLEHSAKRVTQGDVDAELSELILRVGSANDPAVHQARAILQGLIGRPLGELLAMSGRLEALTSLGQSRGLNDPETKEQKISRLWAEVANDNKTTQEDIHKLVAAGGMSEEEGKEWEKKLKKIDAMPDGPEKLARLKEFRSDYGSRLEEIQTEAEKDNKPELVKLVKANAQNNDKAQTRLDNLAEADAPAIDRRNSKIKIEAPSGHTQSEPMMQIAMDDSTVRSGTGPVQVAEASANDLMTLASPLTQQQIQRSPSEKTV